MNERNLDGIYSFSISSISSVVGNKLIAKLDLENDKNRIAYSKMNDGYRFLILNNGHHHICEIISKGDSGNTCQVVFTLIGENDVDVFDEKIYHAVIASR